MAFDYPTLIAAKIHDLKNQMQRIVNQEQTLEPYVSDEEAGKTAFKNLTNSSRVLKKQLGQLISIYNLSRQYNINLAEHWLTDTLEELQEDFNAQYPEAKLILKVPDQLTWVYDEQVLMVGINNAILNAIDAGANEIEIRARNKGEYLHIAVLDNGSGLPEGWAGLKYYEFKEGSGLGLQLMQQVCLVHKSKGKRGKLELTNRSELAGTIAHFCIP